MQTETITLVQTYGPETLSDYIYRLSGEGHVYLESTGERLTVMESDHADDNTGKDMVIAGTVNRECHCDRPCCQGWYVATITDLMVSDLEIVDQDVYDYTTY